MRSRKPRGLRDFGAPAIILALFVWGELQPARAQQPPLTIPNGGPPPLGPNAIPFNGWQLYPELDTFAQYSDNYFLSPLTKISGWSFGLSPSLTAEWSNGIHTTTLYGEFTHVAYPTNDEVTTNDGEATVTQQYAPLRDLNFTFLADYTHHTLATALTSAIPSPIASTASSVLPNGDTVLPNGTIVNSSGQVVGQVAPSPTASALSVVNPYDALTATSKIQKLFPDGVATLGASFTDQSYEEQASTTQDFSARTFTEDASFWLGPVLYAYSDGQFSARSNTSPNPNTDAYRIIGGLGTRQFGLLRASAYLGYQGSQNSGFPSAGGNVYGGALTYYPTPLWTVGANLDVTVNLAPSGAPPSSLALTIPISTPLQVSIGTSSQTTTASLSSLYQISQSWTTNAAFGYSNVQYIGNSTWEDTWFGVATLRYDIRRDLTITWEYQYSTIISNIPLTNASRNFLSMSASYKF